MAFSSTLVLRNVPSGLRVRSCPPPWGRIRAVGGFFSEHGPLSHRRGACLRDHMSDCTARIGPFGCLALPSGLRVGSCPPALAGAIPCDRGDYSPTVDRYRLDAAHGCPTPRGISRVCTIATRHRTIRSPLEAKETSGAICPILLTSYTSQRGNPVTAAPVFKNVDHLRLEMAFSSTFLFAESALRAPGQESPPP